jgi:hypothetical protein
MATTAEEEEEGKIYFRVYRSISFFIGFVEYQQQGLHQQGEKNGQYEHLLRKYLERLPDGDKNQLIKKFNCLHTNFRKELKRIKDSEKKWYLQTSIKLLRTNISPSGDTQQYYLTV